MKNILLVLLAFNLTSCEYLEEESDINNPCYDTFCTEEFITVVVNITDEAENPVILDDFKVINIDNNIDLTIPINSSEEDFTINEGLYPLINDLSLSINQNIEVQFLGYINEVEVVSENFIVFKDCCHVDVADGDLKIIIPND